VREPERVIPRAIMGSIVIVLLLDLAISVAFTGALPWREMIQPGTLIYDAVGSVFMQRVAGFWAGQG
jgi:amino acid transporter